MSRPVRLGAVSYLNARPLVYGLENPALRQAQGAPSLSRGGTITVRFDVPAVCAQLLADGEIDLGLVPTITYLDRPNDRVVPDVAIASDGPVASVAIFTRVPIRDVRRLALDTSSRTSVALTRILCSRRWGIAPAFVPHEPDLAAMLAECDAALLIGDTALFADAASVGATKVDLGEAWKDLTGLPFVWAFWAGPAGPATSGIAARLQQARDAGVRDAATIADAYCEGDVARQALARRYLRDNIRYDLPERALAGLDAFFREAAALGLVPGPSRVRFF